MSCARFRLVLAAALALLPVGAAAEGALLVYGPDVEGGAAGAIREASRVFGVTVDAADVIELGLIEPPFPEALVPFGAAEVLRCPGSPTPVAEIRGTTGAGMAALDSLDYAEATTQLESAWGALRCADAFLERDEVVELPLMLGVLAHYQGSKDAAYDWFEIALAIHPDLAWDNAYPPDAQQVFNNALAETLRAADAKLLTVPDRAAASELRVDGNVVDPLAPQVTFKPGVHLLQWRTTSGAVQSLAIAAEAGQPMVLVSARQLRNAILAGPSAGDIQPAVIDRLAVLASSRGAADVIVVGGNVPYRFDAASSALETPRGGRAAGPADVGAEPRRSPAGPVLVGAGAATVGAGLAIALGSYAQGASLYDELAADAVADYDEGAARYESLRAGNTAGVVIASAGGAVLVTGIIVAAASSATSSTADAGAPPLRVGFAPTPDGGWFVLDLSF